MLRRRLLALADVTTAVGAAIAAGWIGSGGLAAAVWLAATAPLWVLLAKMEGLYDHDHVRIHYATLDELRGLVHWAALSTASSVVLLELFAPSLMSVESALAMFAAAALLGMLLRSGARMLWRHLVPPEVGVVVGDGHLADALARKLALESGHHLALVQHARDAQAIEELVHSTRAERVVLAVPDLDEETLCRVVALCRSLNVKLSVAPPMRAMLGTAVELSHMAELPLIEFRTWDPSRSTMLLKRVADVIGSALALALLWPLMLAIAVVVRLDSTGGPALFRQRRAGKDGEPFTMLKFRTMVPDASEHVAALVDVTALEDPMFKFRDDPRVTRVGRFLRRTSLDELPQLLNALVGQMSLVGPRPEEVWLVDRYNEADLFRFQMRPGITGPMQVHGRGELSFQERMAVEREYVENYSLAKDIRILLRTGSAVLRGRGAF